MSTPTEDAARQAAQQFAALLRALVEITRALEAARARKAQQPPDAPRPPQAAERYAAAIEHTFGPAVRQAMIGSPEWPRMVEHLAHLERAGIDPGQLFTTLGTITRQAVAQQDPTPPGPGPVPDRYAQMLRQHVADPAVADALTTSPEWGRIATQLHDLERSGLDVPRLLAAAQPELNRLNTAIEAAWQRNTAAAPQPQTPTPAQAPVADRRAALQQAGISRHDNERLVRIARESTPPGVGELLAASGKWPLVAEKMAALEQRGIDPAARLSRIRQELTAQAAVSQRPDVSAAALSALSRPAPAAHASRGRGPAAAELARKGPDANLQRAAELAGSRGVISARMLMAEGFDRRETGRLLTELERHQVVGPLGANDTHPARAGSASEARKLVDGQAQRELMAAAASVTSTTAVGPPRAVSPMSAAATKPADTPVRTTVRRR